MNGYDPADTFASFDDKPVISSNEILDTVASKHGMIITPQTKLAFLGYVLLVIVMIIQLVQQQGQPINKIVYVCVYVVIASIVLYGINCTVLGRCNMYAWMVAYILIILGLVSVVGMILLLAK